MNPPEETKEDLSASLLRQEANRQAYLLRTLGKEGLWKWQQAALAKLSQLRPDLARNSSNPPKKDEA